MQPDTTLNVQFNHQDVQLLDKQVVYDGFFEIHRYQLKHKMFSGQWSPTIERECFERGDAAAVLPYDPQRDAVVLVEQFRAGTVGKGASPWLIECVAGIMDASDASPEQVVHREAQEEAGLTLERTEAICQYWVSPGGSSERMHLYCGKVDATLAPGVAGRHDECEDIRVHVVPVETAFVGLANGKLDNALTIMALQWLQLNRSRLQQQWCASQ